MNGDGSCSLFGTLMGMAHSLCSGTLMRMVPSLDSATITISAFGSLNREMGKREKVLKNDYVDINTQNKKK